MIPSCGLDTGIDYGEAAVRIRSTPAEPDTRSIARVSHDRIACMEIAPSERSEHNRHMPAP